MEQGLSDGKAFYRSDFVVQFAYMNDPSHHVKCHVDNDVSFQYGLALGDFSYDYNVPTASPTMELSEAPTTAGTFGACPIIEAVAAGSETCPLGNITCPPECLDPCDQPGLRAGQLCYVFVPDEAVRRRLTVEGAAAASAAGVSAGATSGVATTAAVSAGALICSGCITGSAMLLVDLELQAPMVRLRLL